MNLESQTSKADEPTRRVFVYGTLKRGHSNHGYMAGQRFICEATTQSVYRLFDLGGYPGMIEAASDGLSIKGEIWEIDDACLRRLDVLEDVKGGEYARVFVKLAAPHESDAVEGYVYLRSVARCRDIGSSWGT